MTARRSSATLINTHNQIFTPKRHHPHTASPTNLPPPLRPNPEPPRHLSSIHPLAQQLLPTGIEIPPGQRHLDQNVLIPQEISCSEPCVQLCRKHESAKRRPATPSATPLPGTCWNGARTSAPSKSYSATRIGAQPRSARMCLTAVRSGYEPFRHSVAGQTVGSRTREPRLA